MIRLKELREKKNLTQKQLAERLDVKLGTLQKWEQGALSPSSPSRNKIIQFFKISEGELFHKDAIKTDFQRIPVISWVNANHFATSPIPQDVSDTYVHTTGKGKNMYALTVRKDCMEPEFVEGDIIVIQPDIDAENGDYVIVRDNNSDEATFKQLKRYGRKVILHPLNHKYEDIELDHDDRYQIIGVVVEKVKKYR